MSLPIKPKTESLKLVPQVFFDLIARVVPGAVATVACLLLTGSTWSSVVATVIGGRADAESFPVISMLLFVFSSYVIGQIISPLVKLLQRLTESDVVDRCFRQFPLIGKYCDIECPKPKAPDGDYDFLRSHHPAIGEMCQKIRAEFLMHYGIAVVFLASAVCSLLPTASPAIGDSYSRCFVLCALLIGAAVTTIRARATRDTHEKTIEKFAKALKGEREQENAATGDPSAWPS